MSKGKRGKSTEKVQTGPPKWESTLLVAPYQTETWKMNVYMLVGNKYEDEKHIEACCAAVTAGQRKLFSVASKADIFAKIQEFGNPKNKGKKDVPAHSEICESCKMILDAGDELPLATQARLIKWRLLDIMDADHKRREAQKKYGSGTAADSDDREAAAAGGGGTKRSKSPSKKGKKTPEPSTAKSGSKMKKRIEEDLDRDYIDDEPDDGPQHYVFIHGFHNVDLIPALTEVGIDLAAIIKVTTQDYCFYPEYVPPNMEELTDADDAAIKTRVATKKELYRFWLEIRGLLDKQNVDSSLHQTPELEYTVQNVIIPADLDEAGAKLDFGTVLFEDVACKVYDLLDSKRQYYAYLDNLQLTKVPEFSVPAETSHAEDASSPLADSVDDTRASMLYKWDMRYYSDLMNCVPQECVSVPLILHCMLEQIVATETGSTPPSEILPEPRSDGLDLSVAAHLNHMSFRLALTSEEHELLTDAFDMPVQVQDKVKTPQIINHSDLITNRTQDLKTIYGFHPYDVEMKMLNHSLYTHLSSLPHRSAMAEKMRAARLRELLHFCSFEDVTVSEIHHAFQQFVFECMDLEITDTLGFVTSAQQEGMHTNVIPWDDPYTCCKVSISDVRDEENKVESSQEMKSPEFLIALHDEPSDPTSNKRASRLTVRASTDIPVTPKVSEKVVQLNVQDDESETDDEVMVKNTTPKISGILRPPSKGRSSSANSVRFLSRNESGHPTLDSPDLADKMSDESCKTHSGNENNMADIIHTQKRDLDQWCFTEHFEPHILLQVLNDASRLLPYMDTYYHHRDHSLLVAFHNPTSPQLKIRENWQTELYSDLGFRKYMELVADKVVDWMREEDARHDAHCLTLELDKLSRGDVASKTNLQKGSAKSKASAKAPKKKSPKSSRTTSTERSSQDTDDIYKRPVSLKYQREEQDRLREEEEERERIKAEKRKSPASKMDKKDDKLGKKTPTSRSSSKTKMRKESAMNNVVGNDDEEVVETPPEKYWPFSGYNMGDQVINMSGTSTKLFPCDGGQIIVDRMDILNGTTSVKCSLLKDDHTFVIHILDPRDVPEPPQDPEVIEYERRKLEEKSFNDSDNQDLGIIDLTESLIENKDLPPKPSVSAFGSVTANFCDGMILAFSTFGSSGMVAGEPKKPPETPVPTPEVSPVPTTQRDTGHKGKKQGGKEKAPVTPEPTTQLEEPVVEEEKIVDQPFQNVQVTTPDGLIVNYMLESSMGIVPASEEDRRLVVKMSYPFLTSGEQTCEMVKQKYTQNEAARIVTSDGTVYKQMHDGSCEVLFADGTICKTMLDHPSKPPVNSQVEQTKQSDRSESPKKSSRSGRSAQSADKRASMMTEEKQTVWMKTLPNGEQILVRGANDVAAVGDVFLSLASDPQTKKSMATRDDHVITVSDLDGTLIVEHADGTRITSYYRSNSVLVKQDEGTETAEESEFQLEHVKFVKVECQGYATIEFNCNTSESLTRFGSGSSLNVYADGYYMLHHGNGGKFEIDVEGVVVYYPQPNRYLEQIFTDRDSVYVLRHNTEILCETVDPQGNMFQARYNGEGANSISETRMSNEHDERDPQNDAKTAAQNVIKYKNHAPRFFIIHADASGTELLRYEDIAEYLTDLENDKNSAVIQETLPDQPSISSITILKPYPGTPSDIWANHYDLKSIIPEGIRNCDLKSLSIKSYVVPGPKFGHTLGQGLSIGTAVKNAPQPTIIKCPTKLEVRQLFQYKPMTMSLRSRLVAGIHDYGNYVQQRKEFAEKLRPMDDRQLEERENAEYLRNIALSMKQISEREPVNLGALYEEIKGQQPVSPPPRAAGKRTQADWERDERQRCEAKEDREALRNMIVPPYFSSELGKAFLLAEAMDVTDLLKELSNKDHTAQVSRTLTESKLEDGDSPDHLITKYGGPEFQEPPPPLSRNTTDASVQSNTPVKETMTVGTRPSGIRPTNPTPAHAMGIGSPKLLRPTNPTPSQCNTITNGDTGNHTLTKTGNDLTAAIDPVSNGYHSVKGQPIAEENTTPEYSADRASQKTECLVKTVTGDLRVTPINLPKSVKGGRPGSFPNTKFLKVEEPVRRKVLNSGVMGGTYLSRLGLQRLRGLNLHPQKVHFGVLKEGNTYAYKVSLKNTGVDTCRYKLEQPPLSTGISILYKPGPIAAGMSAVLTIEILAIAVGIEGDSGVGQIDHNLCITSETDMMFLPISATVLTAHDYDMQKELNVRSPGTKLVSTAPPANIGIIRPRICASVDDDTTMSRAIFVT